MTDSELNDLEAYVAEHPEDPVHRWGLAKKLYLDGDFQRSVEHLRFLKDLWPNKVNVRRYLAAGYYRLNRYDEAIDELRGSINQWESDIPIREQLARVYEVAGRRGEAIAVWKEIQQIAPGHAMAVWALSRLQEGITSGGGVATPTVDMLNLTPVDGISVPDGGMLLPNATTCAECGTPNSEEFERCWRCRAPLKGGSPKAAAGQAEVEAFVDPAVHFPVEEFAAHPRLPIWVYAVAIVALLLGCWAARLTFVEWTQYTQINAEGAPKVLMGLDAILWKNLLPLRLILGVVLLLAWPLCIWLSSLLIRGGGARFMEVLVCGLLFSVSAYLILWLPLYRIGYPALILFAASSLGFVLIFRHELGTAVTAWIVQVLMILGIVAVTVASVEGHVFLFDLPAICSFEAEKGVTVHKPGTLDKNTMVSSGSSKLYTPVRLPIFWESSGSQWLDRRVGIVMFEIESDATGSELFATLEQSGESLVTETMKVSPFSFTTSVEPNQQYSLTITGKENTELRIRIFSILESRI